MSSRDKGCPCAAHPNEEDPATLGLLLLVVASVIGAVALTARPETAIRLLAVALLLVILWAAMPALGLAR